jgi:hypothetical protein
VDGLPWPFSKSLLQSLFPASEAAGQSPGPLEVTDTLRAGGDRGGTTVGPEYLQREAALTTQLGVGTCELGLRRVGRENCPVWEQAMQRPWGQRGGNMRSREHSQMLAGLAVHVKEINLS